MLQGVKPAESNDETSRHRMMQAKCIGLSRSLALAALSCRKTRAKQARREAGRCWGLFRSASQVRSRRSRAQRRNTGSADSSLESKRRRFKKVSKHLSSQNELLGCGMVRLQGICWGGGGGAAPKHKPRGGETQNEQTSLRTVNGEGFQFSPAIASTPPLERADLDMLNCSASRACCAMSLAFSHV